MKKLITAILFLASINAQATVDTGKWLLEFDNGWKVTMDMDNFDNYGDAHIIGFQTHSGTGGGGTNFIDIDTGDAATTLTGSAYDVYHDQFDFTSIYNHSPSQPDEIVIRDYKFSNASNQAYNHITFDEGFELNFNETNSFYDNLIQTVGTHGWNSYSFATVGGTVLRDVTASGITLTGVSQVSAVPVPGAVWLMGTALIGLVAKRKVIKL
jgi:hypothetical protein